MAMSPEDLSPPALCSTREDFSQSYKNADGSLEPGRGSRLHRSYSSRAGTMEDNGSGDLKAGRKSPLVKTLMEAEAAANSAAMQLMSFQETLDDDLAINKSGRSASHSLRASRQRNLLLDKLEVFKQINKSVRRQLTELQESEANRLETSKYIDIVLKKLTQAESENLLLKRELSHKEKRVAELLDLRKKEMDNTENVVQMSRSVDATRAHLQGQLRNKEADNNRLSVQLRGAERSLAELKLQNDSLRREAGSLSGRAAHEKESLKKAARAQKQRAERFEAALDKCYTQLREKDVQLLEAHAERDSWRRQQERSIEDRVELDSQIGLLKGQVADLTERLQRERAELSSANQALLQRVEALNAEHGDLNLHNAALKAALAGMERQMASTVTALEEENAVSQERRTQAEQRQSQVAELQAEVDDLRAQLKSLSRATEVREEKEAEAEKVRLQLQGRVAELEGYPGLLRAAQQTLADCQDSLQRSEERCADQADAVRHLQAKVDSQVKKLNSSLEMIDSIQEANSHLRERVDSLQRRLEELQQENQDLVRRLSGQEEALQNSSRHLEQRSAECQALNRQLEAALVDVRQQVARVKEKAVSREGSLQAKIRELEAEKSRRETQLKELRHSKQSVGRETV